jgi:nitroreductase
LLSLPSGHLHYLLSHSSSGVRFIKPHQFELQAASLNLGTVSAGAFDDSNVQKVLNLPPEHKPLYIMPVGRQ